jgi:lambda family phage minor tail protein L
MPYSAWSSATSYSVGDIVAPTTGTAAGLAFRCTVAGTSAATEPSWNTTINVTTIDNTITWLAISALSAEFQLIAPSAIIELFELQLNTTQHGVDTLYRFHAGANSNANGEIVFDGESYMRLPIEATDFNWNGTGQLPRPKLSVSNLMGTITALLLSLPNGLEGAKVTRRRTQARYLDAVNFPGGVSPYTPDPLAEWPREVYFIDRRSTENRDVVEFELASSFDLAGVRAPKRQCINICQWVYRSPECSYTGTTYFDANDESVPDPEEDVCGKRLNSCKLRFGENEVLPFGSFPGIGTFYA